MPPGFLPLPARTAKPHVEVSDGSITLERARKQQLIAELAGEGFTVLSEVGPKDDEEIMAPYRWVKQIAGELEAGAWRVVTEARETGTAGIFRRDGEQVWFLRRFGREVDLGIPPEAVVSLETLRLGLRSDTPGMAR